MVLLKAGNLKKSAGAGGGGGPRGSNILYSLSINAAARCEEKTFKYGDKEYDGYYEDGWFLCDYANIPVVAVHRERNPANKSLPLVLCPRTFADDADCPMCESYQKSRNRGEHPHKAVEHHLCVPFLATERQRKPQIQRSKFEILPIYWFTMNVTTYRDDYRANLDRLEEANNLKNPKTGKKSQQIHKVPYRIFAKHRNKAANEIQEYYFKPLKETSRHEITVEHPLIDDWIGDDGKWLWDESYYEMLNSFVLARFRPYMTDDGPLDHEGQHAAALEYVAEIEDQFPNPRTEREFEQEEDDEELEY